MNTMTNREDWLNLVLVHVRELLADKAGVNVPSDCKVSVGFPGGGSARKRIGECWPRARSSKGVNEIFISPVLRDPQAMVEILVHEAIHASDDCVSGHKGYFRKAALAVGLEGKMTATVAGAALTQWIKDLLTGGAIPSLDYGYLDLSGRKKATTRLLKVVCLECGYTLRTTQKWLDVGLPTCCCGGDMGAC